ncbi:MAG: hypothetical protein H5T33_05575 [Candidatus Methanosuratus sp.]|nr:hypothetical protein [Candidatus Methanosuratincola sp.]
MSGLGVPERYIDAFCGRVPWSVLARHYTDYRPEKLKAIYDKEGPKALSYGLTYLDSSQVVSLKEGGSAGSGVPEQRLQLIAGCEVPVAKSNERPITEAFYDDANLIKVKFMKAEEKEMIEEEQAEERPLSRVHRNKGGRLCPQSPTDRRRPRIERTLLEQPNDQSARKEVESTDGWLPTWMKKRQISRVLA